MFRNKFPLYFSIFITCIFADRISKFFAVKFFNEDLFVSKNINLSLTWNRGVSWGFLNFESKKAFLLLTFFILSIILIFFIHVFMQYKKNFSVIFETLILSGAVSNIVDRFIYGAVVDFLEFHVYDWYWPIFNVADVFVVIGIFGIIMKSVFIKNVY